MKYFTIEELCRSYTAEQHNIANVPNEEETMHLNELVDTLLDPFREFLGRPVTVNSGFRCEELNKLVGGSKTSAHRVGFAADIHVNGIPYRDLWQILLNFCNENQILYDQIFTESDGYSEWIHIGLRNQPGQQRMQSGNWIKGQV